MLVDGLTGSDIHVAAVLLKSEMNLGHRGNHQFDGDSVAFLQSESFLGWTFSGQAPSNSK